MGRARCIRNPLQWLNMASFHFNVPLCRLLSLLYYEWRPPCHRIYRRKPQDEPLPHGNHVLWKWYPRKSVLCMCAKRGFRWTDGRNNVANFRPSVKRDRQLEGPGWSWHDANLPYLYDGVPLCDSSDALDVEQSWIQLGIYFNHK